jgi:hypothetical protein
MLGSFVGAGGVGAGDAGEQAAKATASIMMMSQMVECFTMGPAFHP